MNRMASRWQARPPGGVTTGTSALDHALDEVLDHVGGAAGHFEFGHLADAHRHRFDFLATTCRRR